MPKNYRREEELSRATNELKTYAHLASHDLKEPVRMISSFLQLLERSSRGNLDKRSLEYLHFACEGAFRLHEMINEFVNYLQVENHIHETEIVNLNFVVKDAIRGLSTKIATTGAKVENDFLPSVRGQYPLMIQLFTHLLDNALKFHAQAAPRISIHAVDSPTETTVEIRDNGIGIESEFRERVFALFQRLHPREDYPGNGMGLALCERIIHLQRGKIWLECNRPQGLRVFFTIPKKTN